MSTGALPCALLTCCVDGESVRVIDVTYVRDVVVHSLKTNVKSILRCVCLTPRACARVYVTAVRTDRMSQRRVRTGSIDRVHRSLH
jgi:hypothetical protein